MPQSAQTELDVVISREQSRLLGLKSSSHSCSVEPSGEQSLSVPVDYSIKLFQGSVRIRSASCGAG